VSGTRGVRITDTPNVVIVEGDGEVVRIVAAGPTGPQGVPGPTGATGVVDATAPITYDLATQTVAIDATGYVASVNTSTGVVVLGASDVGAYPDTNPSAFIDAAGAPVQSVNGGTGVVVLGAADVGAYADTNPSSFVDAAGAAAAAPVQSVNGGTGVVVLDASDVGAYADTNPSNFIDSAGAPVQSVNTFTGAVTLGAADVGAVPTSRTISTSGTGLSGGGDLTADRTITLDPTALAGDAAFTGAFVAGQVSGTPAVGELLEVSSVGPLVLVPRSKEDIVSDVIDLVLVVDTQAPSATTTVTLTFGGSTNVRVDWGDGTSNSYTVNGNRTHTYAANGIYTIRVQGALLTFGANVSRPELISVTTFGRLGITSLSQAFRSCANLTQVPSQLPLGVTNLGFMFIGADVFNQDISTWDTSSVTTMASMFQGNAGFNQNISTWDTSSVTTMASMFQGVTVFNQDVSSWDVSSVTDMTNMFNGQNAFQQPLNTWNFVGTVNLSGFMFGKTGANKYNTPMYDDLLVRWAALVAATTLGSARTVSMGGAQFTTAGAGGTARAALVTAGWTIVDGGGI
jgi:surface protein